MSKHTPGPWKATCRDITYKGGDWAEDEFLQWEVEGPRAPRGRGDFFQADARLIAAAPDLLEALKLAADELAIYAPDSWVRTQARAAIKAVEGDTNGQA